MKSLNQSMLQMMTALDTTLSYMKIVTAIQLHFHLKHNTFRPQIIVCVTLWNRSGTEE